MLSILLGMIIGVVSVVFVTQNTALVTVSFLDWQASAPLAVVILASMVLGIIVALLGMVPRAVREALDAYAQKRAERREEALAYAARVGDQNVAA